MSFILLYDTVLGNFRVNGLFLLFLSKALFGFPERINFMKIFVLHFHLSRLRCPAFLLWNKLAMWRRTEGWLKSSSCQKPRSFWSLLRLHWLAFFFVISPVPFNSKPGRNPKSKSVLQWRRAIDSDHPLYYPIVDTQELQSFCHFVKMQWRVREWGSHRLQKW